jgi:DNA topoisomerase I
VVFSKNIKIPAGKLKSIISDPQAAARSINLVYVTDSQEGYTRVRDTRGFYYTFRNKRIRDASELDRIKKLVIPPAWEEVWICKLGNGHLQATGKDTLSRKQYRYHPLWTELRSHTKFYRMLAFGKSLERIRKKVRKDLALPGLPKEKIIALVVSLMENTGIRIGNESYEKLYGSFGLTTLKDKHMLILKATSWYLHLKGKKESSSVSVFKAKSSQSLSKSARKYPGRSYSSIMTSKVSAKPWIPEWSMTI